MFKSRSKTLSSVSISLQNAVLVRVSFSTITRNMTLVAEVRSMRDRSTVT